MDSKVLIKDLFNKHNTSYLGIEMVLYAISVASVKRSCESILASFVSQYENYFDECWNVDELLRSLRSQSLNQFFHTDSDITEALDLYWKAKAWHFIRTSSVEKLMNKAGVSSTLKRLDIQNSGFPFMN